MLDAAKRGDATAQDVFDYYLGYLTDPSDHRPLHPGPGRRRAVRRATGA